MLTLSDDHGEAARQADAIIYLLAAFAYVDGFFDPSEREWLDDFILNLAESLEPDDVTAAGRARRAALTDRLDRRMQRVEAELAAMWDEPTGEGERAVAFVRGRMKVRCLEIFESFDRRNRKTLLAAIDSMLMSDGVAHPEEVAFRDELLAVFHATAQATTTSLSTRARTGFNRVVIHPHMVWPMTTANHASLARLERHWSTDRAEFERELKTDVHRMQKAIRILENRRANHAGWLSGHQTLQQLAGRGSFLDGHVQVIEPRHPAGYELIVLGDLHGCYSCLKAALMQTDFLGKVARFTKAPQLHPEPKLVLLGDYIDRGLYSFQGVLRAALDLFVAAPDHVVLLRGNHEYFFERDGEVHAAVRPADALDAFKPYATSEALQTCARLFEALPNVMFFDDIMFVHGGIPRDAAIRERYVDLGSLNDPQLRYQMLWSDPSDAKHIPEDMQNGTNRFSFGREQARDFLHRIGARTLIRGHEKVDEGYVVHCDEPDLRILTLFSAGGAENWDLPARSSYRKVTPSAITVRYRDNRTDIEPWVIDYATYNHPDRNDFYNDDPG
jgi:hypothetical protein